MHEYDEYMLAVQGCYTLIFESGRAVLHAGDEIFIPRGVSHAGEPGMPCFRLIRSEPLWVSQIPG